MKSGFKPFETRPCSSPRRFPQGTAGVSNPTIRNYEAEMKSLIDYYADRCANIDANQTPVRVTYDILRVILDHPEQTQLGGEG